MEPRFYKDYEAVVEYDDEDKLFIGKVINTRDIIAFDSTSVDELEAAFFAAVDEYLKDCDRLGKNPDKPFSGRFNLILKRVSKYPLNSWV